jgi:type VI secretion system protein ImpF
MAKAELERNAEPSIIDRLIDEDRHVTADRGVSRAESVRRVMDSVRRDIELLLNTRRIAVPTSEALPEVAASLYFYGMPDMTSVSKDSQAAKSRLARQVEETIAAFEPRLENVKVALMPSERAQFGEVRFAIEAMLKLDPTPERVTFDTVLEPGRGAVAVGGSSA